ncbi:uncharacterized protein N7515_009948 [Penicillium bovifimosum]|uniref:Uncharacterized protein n=1 Tax=Penicillium bovifimosum TaxID=126998 RepID=A0A9W9KV45_9EURO|nr:uncharacterized protein N7515_009948 [Penicillium bovifimosum]KAJ5120560.1 hypothetical protein N7515_009948 [Penicillium bovifimosum]
MTRFFVRCRYFATCDRGWLQQTRSGDFVVLRGAIGGGALSPVPRPSEVTTLRSFRSSHLSLRPSPLAFQPKSFVDLMFLF